MNVRLKNRRKVQEPLNELVTRLTLPPELIDAIVDAPMGPTLEVGEDEWIKETVETGGTCNSWLMGSMACVQAAVRDLNTKLQFVSTSGSDVAAVQDVEADLAQLSARVSDSWRGTAC